MAKIFATRGGTPVTELDVSVKDLMEVLVSFHFVHDSAGHTTTRTPAEVSDWVDTMHHIYTLQANVSVRFRSSQRIEVTGDLGPCIRTVINRPRSRTDAWHRVVAQRDSGARFNVFLVWEVEAVDDPGDECALANADCLFDDHVPRVGVALAHELGHCLGLRDHYVDARRHELMFGYAGRQGIFLPKADVEAINRFRTT